ncbi:MAG: hypothetical protein IPL55_18950 [Saprospiraceae bacterium]|nr:hypothetical protein [Saprospiraceae bacterium]
MRTLAISAAWVGCSKTLHFTSQEADGATVRSIRLEPWLRIFMYHDNGSQMVAQKVQSYFKSKKVIQEFTKPASRNKMHIEHHAS